MNHQTYIMLNVQYCRRVVVVAVVVLTAVCSTDFSEIFPTKSAKFKTVSEHSDGNNNYYCRTPIWQHV